ncbi:MAG: aldehyde dehydrogenase family protein [Gemmatimonadetes bacterium]|nr:aldehyde dehydrogenase family protein [Gemmatimonadota bacterium]
MKVAEIFESLDYGPAPESAQPAQAWIAAHQGRFTLFIGGRWTEPHGGEFFETCNPANGKPLAQVAQADAEDAAAAVAAARAALPGWRALEPHARARHLYALARHVQKHARRFAVLESLDNGKPIRESRDIDVPLVARHFYHHAGWAELMRTEFAGYGPVGVVGQIIPWNFPLLMLAWKVAPALAAGNTVVLKPAELTPLTALCFAELCTEVGLPPGVLNIITGDGRTGALLVGHPDVDKIAFTGSTEVGRSIRVAAAGTGKKLSLELGGKSPFIVFEDADLDGVVEGVVDAIWFNQGQVCCAGSRILVQEGCAERLIARLRARMETLRIGDPLDKSIDIGAIIAPVQLDRITRLVAQGRSEGATVWQPSWSCPEEGCFYPPTLCTDVAPADTIAQEEIFGPVVVLMTFRTPAEAVALANNTRYGLAASVWTENVNLALDVAPQLKAGTVWVNSSNVFDAASGFGGYRESGFGREGGREGIWEYVRAEWEPPAPAGPTPAPPSPRASGDATAVLVPAIDRTAKLYIGGRQERPDSGCSLPVHALDGERIGEVGQGTRKDVRDAVEAAHRASGWARASAHSRAQVLYFLAENLAARSEEIARRIGRAGFPQAETEVELAIRRLFLYAAWADKWDGQVHHTPFRNVTIAMPEPVGVLGVVCADEAPLLGFVSAVFPAVAMGNTVVALPSETLPLAATDLYQVLDTSDLPGGVVNIITGQRRELVPTLAGHDDVDGLWCFAGGDLRAEIERLAAGNMKRTWHAPDRDWLNPLQAEGPEFLRHACEIKNIWVPYGA